MKKKLLPILLSLFVAFIAWSYVVIVIGPEYRDTFYNIKVDLDSVSKALDEEGKMLLLTEEAYVTLELSGNRVDLNKLNSGNIYISVDDSKLTPGKTQYRVDIRYPDNVSEDAFTVEGQYPSTITLDVAWRAEKTVKVEVEFDDDMIPENYGNLPVELEFTELTIVGPEDDINRIAVAKVKLELTEENNKTGIFNEEYRMIFCDENNEAVDSRHVRVPKGADKITVSLPIRMKKVLPLKLYVKEGGGATIDNVSINPASITVLGTEEALADLNEWYLNTEETALDLSAVQSGVLSYDIKNLPENVTNRSGKNVAEVTVSLEDLQMMEYTLDVKEIQQVNVPTGIYPDISEVEIKVIVRGTKEKIQALQLSQIVAEIDFSDAKEGQMKEWPVKVSIKGKPEDIGVVGNDYTVWVTVKDISQKPVEQQSEE